MPPVGFEPTISAGEWPKTYALDLTATVTDISENIRALKLHFFIYDLISYIVSLLVSQVATCVRVGCDILYASKVYRNERIAK